MRSGRQSGGLTGKHWSTMARKPSLEVQFLLLSKDFQATIKALVYETHPVSTLGVLFEYCKIEKYSEALGNFWYEKITQNVIYLDIILSFMTLLTLKILYF